MSSRAQIVATIGPASGSLEIIKKLIEHQMDVVRLNFSWGTYDEHKTYINNIREAAEEAEKRIPIIQDLAGPRVDEEGGHHFGGAKDIITEKDKQDLKFGVEQEIDYVAMSYVSSAADIIELKGEMEKLGRQIPIIAKIERKEAIENIDEILKVSDAIMVARGDMANEVPIEQIPFIQRTLIEKAKAAKKPVITATQMLISMVENPEPTRAELTDVSQAILEGSDAVMLSEETARGKYPVEAVSVMEKLVLEAEKHEKKIEINPL